MQLVSNPKQFDVMVMPNLYGNIVSNIGAGLVGGAGVCSGKNVGRDFVLFEQGARHTGLELAFQNRANPTAMLLSATAMLRHLGCVQLPKMCRVYFFNFCRLHQHWQLIEAALFHTLQNTSVSQHILLMSI